MRVSMDEAEINNTTLCLGELNLALQVAKCMLEPKHLGLCHSEITVYDPQGKAETLVVEWSFLKSKRT
jgi:hypothetical protein